MTRFESLFGIKAGDVGKNCLLLPFVGKEILSSFGVEKLVNGKLYSSATADNITLIRTGLGPGLVGDAVLHLKEDTACENVTLFGSCGATSRHSGLSLGSVVTPSICHSNESFSEFLLERNPVPRFFYPDKEFSDRLIKSGKKLNIRQVVMSTIPSLKLEEEMTGVFIDSGIDVVDMECSAFLAAAGHAGLRTAALFYVSDIIKDQPFYNELGLISKAHLSTSIKNAASFLCEFIQKNMRG